MAVGKLEPILLGRREVDVSRDRNLYEVTGHELLRAWPAASDHPRLLRWLACLPQPRQTLPLACRRRLSDFAFVRRPWPCFSPVRRYPPRAGPNGGGLCWRATRRGITRPTVRQWHHSERPPTTSLDRGSVPFPAIGHPSSCLENARPAVSGNWSLSPRHHFSVFSRSCSR